MSLYRVKWGLLIGITLLLGLSVAQSVIHQIEFLLLVGVGWLVPLILPLVSYAHQRDFHAQLYHWLQKLHFPTALMVGAALLLPQGLFAGLLALGWLIFTVLLAGLGLFRWLQRPASPVEEFAIDAGLIYAAISGIWFVAYSFAIPFLGFDLLIVLLTAVHFCFISLGGLVVTGMVGRAVNHYQPGMRHLYRIAAWGVIVSPALVALGITFSPVLETVSVLLLAISLLMIAVITLSLVKPLVSATGNRLAAGLIAFSASSLFLTMAMSLAYALGRYTGWWQVTIPDMVMLHGWVNALAFSLPGLLGWSLITPSPQIGVPSIPFSRLPWRWQIGSRFFERINGLDNAKTRPLGIVDVLSDYQRDSFDAAQVCDSVRAFYEHTGDHILHVYPIWTRPFFLPSRLYKQISRRVQQMNLPLRPESAETDITSMIVPLNDALDGRQRVRGWIRTYTATSEAVYVAAYSNHRTGNNVYMNIAFPLPGGNLTSILHIDPLKVPGYPHGMRLTSLPESLGDQGLYYVTRLGAFRLPINETITVYPAGARYDGLPADFCPDASVYARHDMWMFGLRFLTLHYAIMPKSSPSEIVEENL